MAESGKILSLVVGLVVALIVIAFLLPVGISNFYNANWTQIGMYWNETSHAWEGTATIDASIASMINTIIPVMIVMGIVLAIIAGVVYTKKVSV